MALGALGADTLHQYTMKHRATEPQGEGLLVWDLGLRAKDLGFRVQHLGLRI